MRLGSLNVHYDLLRVLREKRNSILLDMDVLLVQEFQSARGDWEKQQAICRSIGLWAESFGEWERDGYPNPKVCHGIAIFTRYPIIETSLLGLPRISRTMIHTQGISEERRQRLAISCTLQTREFGMVQVVNTHLDTQLTTQERLFQFSPILKIIRPDSRAIVGGDLNTDAFEWIPTRILRLPYPPRGDRSAKKIWRLAESRGLTTIFKNIQTHQWLPLQLDGIFTKGMLVKNRGICKIKGTDHRLLWIEF